MSGKRLPGSSSPDRESSRSADTLDDGAVRRTRRRLLRWGRKHFRPFAWRSETDPWLSFVAEFLLQRTRATQVEPVFVEIRDRLPTAGAVVDGGPPLIRSITDRLGLHWRGPLLLDIAAVVNAQGGSPPESMDELTKLTGIGAYTAAAWLSLHRGKRAVIIDANVCRWLSRMTGLPYNRDPRGLRWVQELAERLTPRRVFRDFNYAVLDFTMTVCTPRNPVCATCPLRSDCRHGQAVLTDNESSVASC